MKRYLLLGSRIALGVYVPAVSLKKELEKRGFAAEIICLEDFYKGKDEVIEETKKSLHEDFRLAKMSYRLPTWNLAAADEDALAGLMNRVRDEGYDAIVTFSGFWVDFLNELADTCPFYKDRIYAVHMDAGYSLSWKDKDKGAVREIWLYNLEENRIDHLPEEPDTASEPEDGRILVHGGGWGIGEYRNKTEQLRRLGYKLDIIIYYPEEIDDTDDMCDYYLLDPSWQAGRDESEYPRLLKYEDGEWRSFGDGSGGNPLRLLMKRASAVLSKPGGGTLADSLATATPIIFSEELAAYEAENKRLWISKGCGAEYADFAAMDRSAAKKKLCGMRHSILEIQQGLPQAADVITKGC
ncbi:MAG: hypothetical protein J6D07_00915 [Mogibacterium sp.]|nr:hypothetical protein [Mogibacterium sp.]